MGPWYLFPTNSISFVALSLIFLVACVRSTSFTLTPIHSVMYFRDDWPKMPDGSDFDGKQLLTLVRSGNSPFRGVWDVNLLIRD